VDMLFCIVFQEILHKYLPKSRSMSVFSLVQAAGVSQRQMDTISNNLANVNTTGYKEDRASFKEVLSKAQRVVPESTEESFVSHEYMDQYVGMDKSSVVLDQVGMNFTLGRTQQTNNDLDLLLENDGFFTVNTPQGERFTRAGNFQLDAQNRIVTTDGFPVMGKNGAIVVQNRGDLNITEQGDVWAGGEQIDSLKTVRFRNPNRLQKLGRSFFAPVHSDDVPIPSKEIRVKQGYLEGSNVNTVTEMTRMINASRSYDSAHKALTSIDRLDEKAINLARIR